MTCEEYERLVRKPGGMTIAELGVAVRHVYGCPACTAAGKQSLSGPFPDLTIRLPEQTREESRP